MKWDRRRFLQATPATIGLAIGGSSGCSAVSPAQPPVIGRSTRRMKEGDGVAMLELGAKASLCILQITDLHFFGRSEGREPSAADATTAADLKRYIQNEKPDLVLASGDLWHDNPGGRGQHALEHAVRELGRLETPWAMCWGNHDQLDDYQRGHDVLEGAPGSLYRGGGSHGDYRIVARASGGQHTVQLHCLNSHRFGLGPWQLDALGQALRQAEGPALAFFHIPVLEQKTLYRAGVTKGIQGEKVCHEEESGQAVPVLAGHGSIRACFCGHDHVNDYAVTTRSLSLVYGRATGHAGYGGETVRKGAKRIEFDLATAAWTQVTVFPDGSRWTPA